MLETYQFWVGGNVIKECVWLKRPSLSFGAGSRLRGIRMVVGYAVLLGRPREAAPNVSQHSLGPERREEKRRGGGQQEETHPHPTPTFKPGVSAQVCLRGQRGAEQKSSRAWPVWTLRGRTDYRMHSPTEGLLGVEPQEERAHFSINVLAILFLRGRGVSANRLES